MLLARAWAAVEKDGAGDAAPPDLSVRIASLLAIVAVVRLDYPAMLRFGNEAVEGRASDDWVAAFAWLSRLVGLALGGPCVRSLIFSGTVWNGGRATRSGWAGGSRDRPALDRRPGRGAV